MVVLSTAAPSGKEHGITKKLDRNLSEVTFPCKASKSLRQKMKPRPLDVNVTFGEVFNNSGVDTIIDGWREEDTRHCVSNEGTPLCNEDGTQVDPIPW